MKEQMYNSTLFSKFMELYNHNQILDYFHYPRSFFPCAYLQVIPAPSSSFRQPQTFWVYLFWIFHISGIINNWFWLLQLCIIFLRFICVVTVSVVHSFLSLKNISLYKCDSLYLSIHQWTFRYLDYFQFWIIKNNAAMNIHMPDFVGTCGFTSVG